MDPLDRMVFIAQFLEHSGITNKKTIRTLNFAWWRAYFELMEGKRCQK